MTEFSGLQARAAEWADNLGVEVESDVVEGDSLTQLEMTDYLQEAISFDDAQFHARVLRRRTFESFGVMLATAEKLAGHIEAFASLNPSTDPDVRVAARFGALAAEWKRDTQFSSDLTEIVLHQAYQKIIGLGPPAVPLILRDLEERPAYWFWALASIVGEDVAEGAETVTKAAEQWIAWGREREFV
jgi:hypothetical protein